MNNEVSFIIICGVYNKPKLIVFQDMQEMRESYDRLLSVAAATANSAYGKYIIIYKFSTFFLMFFFLFLYNYISRL